MGNANRQEQPVKETGESFCMACRNQKYTHRLHHPDGSPIQLLLSTEFSLILRTLLRRVLQVKSLRWTKLQLRLPSQNSHHPVNGLHVQGRTGGTGSSLCLLQQLMSMFAGEGCTTLHLTAPHRQVQTALVLHPQGPATQAPLHLLAEPHHIWMRAALLDEGNAICATPEVELMHCHRCAPL